MMMITTGINLCACNGGLRPLKLCVCVATELRFGLEELDERTHAPTLNFTNLNYQVAVSPSLGRGFYRLKQP